VGRPERYDTAMRRAEVIARVSARRAEIVERFRVRSLSLFGSVARDQARPESDVDLLVEFEGPTTFDAHMGLLLFLEDLLGQRVDLVTAKGLKPRLRPLIGEELVRVA
jgi:predicted nucleotidyltransferase